MAWIQVHQQLKDHRKLLAAADELEIEPAHMLGLLISFWLWALDNAPSGSLQGISTRMIARAAQWSGSPDDFVQAMAHAGLLDEEQDGSLTLHDWYEYTGKLIDQREAEKNRSRRRRAAAAASQSDDRRTTAGQTGGQPPDDQKKTGGRVDQTIQDQSTPDKTTQEGDRPPNPPEPKQDAQERRFSEFWQQYPKKVGKRRPSPHGNESSLTPSYSSGSCRRWPLPKPQTNGGEKVGALYQTRRHGSIRDAGTTNCRRAGHISRKREASLPPWTCSPVS